MLGIGQVHIEQARLAAGVLVPALEGVDSEQYKELNQEELEDLSKAQGRDANAKLMVALKKVQDLTLVASACLCLTSTVSKSLLSVGTGRQGFSSCAL